MKKDFIYLASASPRRSELLRQIGVRFEVVPARFPRCQETARPPTTTSRRLARGKADAIWERIRLARSARSRSRPVLAADTAVVIDERVLGKPADTAEAMAMLADLSGRTHRVLTAVALRCGRSLETLLCRSEVRFRATSAEERAAYCRSGEPFDKAGGYGIQGRAAVFIEHLSGSYSSVVGLPLFETALLLERCGVSSGAIRQGRARTGGPRGEPRQRTARAMRGRRDEARRDPDQRDVARSPRRARRERRAAGGADRAREPPRADQQHLQGQGLARAARHAGGVRRHRARAHRVPARVRHRAARRMPSTATTSRRERSRRGHPRARAARAARSWCRC